MLTSLYIKNYALIDELNVQFGNGFTIITGETGAGKSILLGGLSLVLGKRADLSQIKNKEQKCIIEAVFDVANYNLKSVFTNLDLDYDVNTIIRREILPSGKSRAFVNDTPTTLDSLSYLSEHLIDIHSQHQTQQLVEDYYQFQVIDALAGNRSELTKYASELEKLKKLRKSLEQLNSSKAELIKEYDYNLFLYNELDEIDLADINMEELESSYDALNNVEEIEGKLSFIQAIMNNDEMGILDQLQSVRQELTSILGYGKVYEGVYNRLESTFIELKDLTSDLESLMEDLTTDPQELERLSNLLQILNNLFQKHSVSQIQDLLAIKEELDMKVGQTENLDDIIKRTEQEFNSQNEKLLQLAATISDKRNKAIPVLTSRLEEILIDLGMPNARFKIELDNSEQFKENGCDNLRFMFTANKGASFNELKKAASGGELSRIMLAIKSILADYEQLPSIMFDEIDTGVSGEISNKMGSIMKQMSKRMQVFTITHLPQIAAKGNAHFKVYKTDKSEITKTELKRLAEDERIVEIAQMLGGLNVTESALAHAKQLLN